MNIRDFINIVMEATSVPQAIAVFRKYGYDARNKTPEQIKQKFKEFARKHHPDMGGNSEIFKEISDATDILTKANPQVSIPKKSTFGKNFHHSDYFQEKMDELSLGKKGRAEYTIWNFDGYFFRNCITVFGCPEIFDEMVEAMKIWEDRLFNCRAIFVHSKYHHMTTELELIYLDGKMSHPPIMFEHDSFNLNPGNDQQFVRKLPELLDKISGGQHA
jgi:hypothetical protein